MTLRIERVGNEIRVEYDEGGAGTKPQKVVITVDQAKRIIPLLQLAVASAKFSMTITE